MCGTGIIFIDTFSAIRVLSNFAGRTGYTTFFETPPGGVYWRGRLQGVLRYLSHCAHESNIRCTSDNLATDNPSCSWIVREPFQALSNQSYRFCFWRFAALDSTPCLRIFFTKSKYPTFRPKTSMHNQVGPQGWFP